MTQGKLTSEINAQSIVIGAHEYELDADGDIAIYDIDGTYEMHIPNAKAFRELAQPRITSRDNPEA